MALMLSVYLGKGPHTVRGLAQGLNISKPAVSRALDRLGELGYIRRERDEMDRRNVLVRPTPDGANFLLAFSEMIRSAEGRVAQISDQQTLDFALEAMTATAASLGASTAPSADAPAQTWTDVAA